MNRSSGSHGETPTQESVRNQGMDAPNYQQTDSSSLPAIPGSSTMSTIPAARGTPMGSTAATETGKAKVRVAPRKDTPGRWSNVLKYLKNELVPQLAEELPKGLTVVDGDDSITIEVVKKRLDNNFYNSGLECMEDIWRLCVESKEKKNAGSALQLVRKLRLPTPEVFCEDSDDDFILIDLENEKETEVTSGEQEEAVSLVTPKKNPTQAPFVLKIQGKRNRTPSDSDNMTPYKSANASNRPMEHCVRRNLSKDIELDESDSSCFTWNMQDRDNWINYCRIILHELATRRRNSRQMFWKKSQYIWGFVDMSQDAVANLTDLTEIEEKLGSGHYKSRQDFFTDVDKVFSDCVDLNSDFMVKGNPAYFISLAKSAQNYVWARERDFFPNLELTKTEKEDPKSGAPQLSEESSSDEC